jgi:hypothetical protein
MNRNYKQQGMYSSTHQQAASAEISRQIEEFLKKGGKIETLNHPQFQPHRCVGVKGGVTEVL